MPLHGREPFCSREKNAIQFERLLSSREFRDSFRPMPLHRHEKTGRNDPCPCGSGKKHKHCCLTAAASDDSPWRQQRDASGRLAQEMLNYARQNFAEDVLDAWLDFNQNESPLPLEEDVDEGQIFLPYLLFDWDPRTRRRRGQAGMGLVAQAYLLKQGSRLAQLERLILDQATTQPVTFYEVVHCHPGDRMVLRDVLIGGEAEVVERTASRTLRPGDLAYGQLCRLPEVVTLGRMAPLSIPPGNKVAIVGLRARLQKKIAKQNRELTAADLIRYQEEIRTIYLDLRDGMRMPPRLTNTDGDPFLSHTLNFRVGSAHAAFEVLAPLAWGVSKQELVEDAKLDADGTLRSVEIPWLKRGNRLHRDWDNTVLGQMKISGRSLVVDVNSEKRATRIRHEIERRLGILAVHQKTVTQTTEAMRNKQSGGTARRAASGAASNRPSPQPEFNQEMKAELQQLAERWIFQKVPALGGRTPLEAVGTADGKEIVESLLLQWERQNENIDDPTFFLPDVNAVRRLLKLNPSAS
jgi:hypothetical protein